MISKLSLLVKKRNWMKIGWRLQKQQRTRQILWRIEWNTRISWSMSCMSLIFTITTSLEAKFLWWYSDWSYEINLIDLKAKLSIIDIPAKHVCLFRQFEVLKLSLDDKSLYSLSPLALIGKNIAKRRLDSQAKHFCCVLRGQIYKSVFDGYLTSSNALCILRTKIRKKICALFNLVTIYFFYNSLLFLNVTE